MLHFLVEITYTAPLDAIDHALPAHRAFLQRGYDAGLLLMSGPQNPRSGGVIIARAPTREALAAFFADDPYRRAKLADYRIVEFAPVKRQPFLNDWCSAETP
jgi:uncharacterized protein YciI